MVLPIHRPRYLVGFSVYPLVGETMNWKLALDIQMDTHKWCMSEYGMLTNSSVFYSMAERHAKAGITKLRDNLTEASVDSALMLNSILYRGDTCYVTSDMLHLTLQAAHDLPDDISWESRDLLTPVGFLLLEEPLHGEDLHGHTMGLSAIAWKVQPVTTTSGELREVCHMFFFTSADDDEDWANKNIIPHMRSEGEPIPPLFFAHWYPAIIGMPLPHHDDRPGAEVMIMTLRLFYAFNKLAHQTIGKPIELRPDRASRKRFAREHPDEPERVISLITLRRKSVKKDDHEPQKVDWSRRWIVRGFWRKQWYPKAQRHDWKYIHEYVKGPEDKPLVITERRVFNFRR